MYPRHFTHLSTHSLPDPANFVKTIKRSQNSVALIYEDNYLDVASIETLPICLAAPKKKRATTVGDWSRLHFETVLYDVQTIAQNHLLVSCRDMPVRIYGTDRKDFSSISDKKANSESFLTPIQFAQHNNIVVGGGRRFLSVYDVGRKTIKSRPKQFEKTYISCVALLDQKQVIVGDFEGKITLADLSSSSGVNHLLQPHVDAVTQIKPNSANTFLTLARKDNYSYMWDIRNLTTFVQIFENPLFGNQRTGLQVSLDQTRAYFGSEDGKIMCKATDTGAILGQIGFQSNLCVSSICRVGQRTLICSVGSRTFPLQNEPNSSGFVEIIAE